MQELEKILEEMRQIKDGNRKENLYAKYPPNGKDQEVLNAYSQGYEDGTDNFYNAVVYIIRKHMNDGWIPVEKELPKEKINPLSQDYCEYQVTAKFEDATDVRHYKFGNGHWWHGPGIVDKYVIAWRENPEPYHLEQPETCKYTGGSCCWPIDQCRECPNHPERSEGE